MGAAHDAKPKAAEPTSARKDAQAPQKIATPGPFSFAFATQTAALHRSGSGGGTCAACGSQGSGGTCSKCEGTPEDDEHAGSGSLAFSFATQTPLRRRAAAGEPAAAIEPAASTSADSTASASADSIASPATASPATAPKGLPPSVGTALAGPSAPLDAGTRDWLEPRFARDLGHVRLHTGALATKAAEDVGALAFTVGSDIAVRSDAYAPQTTEGKKLLAHEVVHALQPAGGALQQRSAISQPDDPAEREADSLAEALVGPEQDRPVEPVTPAEPALHRAIDPNASFTLPSIEYVATVVVSTSGMRAIVHPTTKFSAGPKVHQGLALFFHAVAASSYDKDRVVAFITALANKFPAANPMPGFTGDAKGGEKFPTDVQLGHEFAVAMLDYFDSQSIAHIITPAQREVLSLGKAIDFFIAFVGDPKGQSALGVTLPEWYPLASVGRRDLANFGDLLRAYREKYDAWTADSKNKEKLTAMLGSMTALLKQVAAPALALEEIRKDADLANHPSYKLIWPTPGGPATKPEVGSAAPTAPTGPLTPGTIAPETQAPDPTFMSGFINFARTQFLLLDKVSDPAEGADARRQLLDLFISWAPHALAVMPTDEKILKSPALANMRPHPATLKAIPTIGPPFYDAALESEYHFEMQLQFPDVFEAFGASSRFDYQWERIKLPKTAVGAAADISKLKGETPTLGEAASLRYKRAGEYAYEDITRAVSTYSGLVGPPGVSVDLASLNAAFRYLGTTFSLGIDALFTPASEKKITFLDGEGFYIIVCRASQISVGKGFIRAQSVAWMPVFVRAAGAMAETRLAAAITNRDDAKKRLEEIKKLLDSGAKVPDHDALVKEAEDLYKVLESPTEARYKQIDDLEKRKAKLEERIKAIEGGEPPNPGEVLFSLKDELRIIEKQLDPLKKIAETRAGRSTTDHDLSKSEPLNAVFVDDKGQSLYLVLEAVHMSTKDGVFKYYVSDTTTPKSTDDEGEGPTKEQAILAAVRKILKSAKGYGRGQLSIDIGGKRFNERIGSSDGAMVLEAMENLSLALSIAAVAAAPFTGGASLVLMIPAGIVGAIPSAYRIITALKDSTFHLDLEFAMDLVNIVGSLVGLGEVAVPLRFVRVGKALMVIGAGVNGLGIVLMGAQMMDQMLSLGDLPPGMRAARIMAILGQALLQAGIMVGQHLVASAKVKSMEAAVGKTAEAKLPEHLEKAFNEWESSLKQETRTELAGDPDLLKFYREMDPAVRKALTLCASPCIPTKPRPTPADVARIQKIMNDLGFPPDSPRLREYLGRNKKDITNAIDRLQGAKNMAEAFKIFESSIASHAEGGTAAKGGDGKWRYTRAADSVVVVEHSVATHGKLTEAGTEGFFESHHGAQDTWAKEVGLEKYGYTRDDCPAILLRDSHGGSPHQRITARQKAREGGRNKRTYAEERQNLRDDMIAAEVPPETANKLLAESDAYFGKLHKDIETKLRGEGKNPTEVNAELQRLFGEWYPGKP